MSRKIDSSKRLIKMCRDSESGDTAEGLAVREFSSALRDGHDLRYYENVLLHVNRQHGRAGVRGSYQEPGVFGGGANNVQLEAGRRIWLVSPAYARALEGVVPDGSLTNGAVAKVKRFAGHIEDLIKSVTESPGYLGEVAGEYAQVIRDHMVEIVGIVASFIAAEALSAFLAATPTGVGQIAAVVIQLGLAAFGAAGMVAAGVQALEHAAGWLNLAWTAHGDEAQIAAAGKEFLKMLVSIAMAALAYVGVKGNFGKAAAIADSMPAMMPAFAVAGGGQMGGAVEGTAVATGIPGPAGPLGIAMAMSTADKGKGGGSDKAGVPEKEAATEQLEFEPAPYHGRVGNAVKRRGPKNGQAALDNSLQVKATSPRRIGIDHDAGEFVVLDQTSQGVFHGHVRPWSDLTPAMKKTLIDAGMVNKKGRILTY